MPGCECQGAANLGGSTFECCGWAQPYYHVDKSIRFKLRITALAATPCPAHAMSTIEEHMLDSVTALLQQCLEARGVGQCSPTWQIRPANNSQALQTPELEWCQVRLHQVHVQLDCTCSCMPKNECFQLPETHHSACIHALWCHLMQTVGMHAEGAAAHA